MLFCFKRASESRRFVSVPDRPTPLFFGAGSGGGELQLERMNFDNLQQDVTVLTTFAMTRLIARSQDAVSRDGLTKEYCNLVRMQENRVAKTTRLLMSHCRPSLRPPLIDFISLIWVWEQRSEKHCGDCIMVKDLRPLRIYSRRYCMYRSIGLNSVRSKPSSVTEIKPHGAFPPPVRAMFLARRYCGFSTTRR